jgi:hypothetical protein
MRLDHLARVCLLLGLCAVQLTSAAPRSAGTLSARATPTGSGTTPVTAIIATAVNTTWNDLNATAYVAMSYAQVHPFGAAVVSRFDVNSSRLSARLAGTGYAAPTVHVNLTNGIMAVYGLLPLWVHVEALRHAPMRPRH